MKRFFLVLLAVMVMVAGFTALQASPISATGNPAKVTFGPPEIQVTTNISVVLTEEYSPREDFKVYKFNLKNTSSRDVFFQTGFTRNQPDAVEYQYWNALFSSNGELAEGGVGIWRASRKESITQ